jgi:hypothetical protein
MGQEISMRLSFFGRYLLAAAACATLLATAGRSTAAPIPQTIPQAATAAPTFAAFVDAYLDRFGHYHPSIAAGNGLHDHDGELEDFSAAAIASEIQWQHSVRRQLDGLDPGKLTADERVDRRILQGVVDGWLLDLETVRNWTRNPMIYVSTVSDGLHDLITMESSPPDVRMQRALTKLGVVPALIAGRPGQCPRAAEGVRGAGGRAVRARGTFARGSGGPGGSSRHI